MLKNYLQFCKKSPLIYISETRNTKSPDSHRGLSLKTYQNVFESKLHSKSRIYNACACMYVYRCVCPLMCVQVHLCEGYKCTYIHIQLEVRGHAVKLSTFGKKKSLLQGPGAFSVAKLDDPRAPRSDSLALGL